jgi:hypothetical protein
MAARWGVPGHGSAHRPDRHPDRHNRRDAGHHRGRNHMTADPLVRSGAADRADRRLVDDRGGARVEKSRAAARKPPNVRRLGGRETKAAPAWAAFCSQPDGVGYASLCITKFDAVHLLRSPSSAAVRRTSSRRRRSAGGLAGPARAKATACRRWGRPMGRADQAGPR